jgi:hypothetical protein
MFTNIYLSNYRLFMMFELQTDNESSWQMTISNRLLSMRVNPLRKYLYVVLQNILFIC